MSLFDGCFLLHPYLQSTTRPYVKELDRCELREVFQSMGVPISEQMLSELMDRFDLDNR